MLTLSEASIMQYFKLSFVYAMANLFDKGHFSVVTVWLEI